MCTPASALDTIPTARVSFPITYKHPLLGTSLPKGSVGHGVQLLSAQIHSCRKTHRDISFGSRQIKYLSVAKPHNKTVFKSRPCSPRGLSGILKVKEFLVAPKPSSSTVKIYAVVPYQKLIKYNLKCLEGRILLIPSIVTWLLPLEILFLYTSCQMPWLQPSREQEALKPLAPHLQNCPIFPARLSKFRYPGGISC